MKVIADSIFLIILIAAAAYLIFTIIAIIVSNITKKYPLKYRIKLKKHKSNKPFYSYIQIWGVSSEFVDKDRRLIEMLSEKFFVKSEALVLLATKYGTFFTTEKTIEISIPFDIKEEIVYGMGDLLWLYISRANKKFFDLLADCWRKGGGAEIVIFGISKTELNPILGNLLHIKSSEQISSVLIRYPQSIRYLFFQGPDGFALQISFSDSSDIDLGYTLVTSCIDMIEKEFANESQTQ